LAASGNRADKGNGKAKLALSSNGEAIDTTRIGLSKNKSSADVPQLSTQADGDQTVIDDLPMYVPVTVRELDVIELYLQSVLEEFFGKCKSDHVKNGIEGDPRIHFKRDDS
jgi:hypothetical protein